MENHETALRFFNPLVPELDVTDIDKTLWFYCDIIGFKVEYARKEHRFAFLSYGKAQLMVEQYSGNWETGALTYPFGRGMNLQIFVPDLAAIEDRLLQAEVPLFRDKRENTYVKDGVALKMLELLVQDPDGYLLRFSQHM